MAKMAMFEGKNVDLKEFRKDVRNMLKEEKFGIKNYERNENTFLLKAEKTDIGRIVLGGTKDVSLVITGDSDSFVVSSNVEAWGKNLTLTGKTGLILAGPDVGTTLDAGSFVTAKKFEEDLWIKMDKKIKERSMKK
jgi:hypothetical protein